MAAANSHTLFTTLVPPTSYDLFMKCFLDLFNLKFPIRTVRFNKNIHKLEKWITTGLFISRRTKISLGKTATKNPSLPNKEKYVAYRNLITNSSERAKSYTFKKSYRNTNLICE
jgi:hypothetical protein